MIRDLMLTMALTFVSTLALSLLAFAIARRSGRYSVMTFWMGVSWASLMGAFFAACWLIGGALALL